jgi:hypothetical protein
MNAKIDAVEAKVNALDAKIDVVDAKVDTVDYKLDNKIELIQEGLFTSDEKESMMDTVKLVNKWLEADVLGKESITLTREEYDATARAQGFSNRFENPKLVLVEME